MTGLEALHSVRFVAVRRKALADLQAAGADRQQAGWREWADAEKELK